MAMVEIPRTAPMQVIKDLSSKQDAFSGIAVKQTFRILPQLQPLKEATTIEYHYQLTIFIHLSQL